jgi:hypothetical protein
MADEKSQVEEETSWWAFDGFTDSEPPSISFDEPLEWPDSLPWEEFSAGTPATPTDAPPAPVDLVFPSDADAGPAAPPAPAPPQAEAGADRQWQPGSHDPDATMPGTPLAALGGAPGAAPAVGDPTTVEPLPDSIWSFDDVAGPDDQVAGLASLSAPLVYADGDGKAGVPWLRRIDIRRGNVAVVALISAVSLMLLGMFLSVRSRNDLPTDTRQTQSTSDQIAVGNPRNTVVITTSVPGSTSVPEPAINIADLVPPTEVPADTGAGGGTGTRTAVATTAPARSTAAPAGGGGGGGGSTATTQPAPQSTATTAAPEPPPTVTTAAPPPPVVEDTTPTTRRPPPTAPSFTVPSIPTTTPPDDDDDPPFSIPVVTFPNRN